MAIAPGHAIVDPGAAQDLIGEKAFKDLQQRLAQVGLWAIALTEDPPTAAGIGGNAKPLYNALAPVFLGGAPGVVKLTVLQEEVPQLLSIGLLEHTKAMIDTGSNEIVFKALNTSAPMKRLESGHRVLDIVQGASKFRPPCEVLQKYGLEADAFEAIDSASSEQYPSCVSEGFLVFQSPKFQVTIWDIPERGNLKHQQVDFTGLGVEAGATTECPWEIFLGIGSDAVVPLGNHHNGILKHQDNFHLVGSIISPEPIDHEMLVDKISKEHHEGIFDHERGHQFLTSHRD